MKIILLPILLLIYLLLNSIRNVCEHVLMSVSENINSTMYVHVVPFSNEPSAPPRSSLYPFVTGSVNADAVVAKLREYMTGKLRCQPKDTMRPVRAAQDAGVIRRITWEEMKVAFPDSCPVSRASVIKYTNPDEMPYTDQAFSVMVKAFESLKM